MNANDPAAAVLCCPRCKEIFQWGDGVMNCPSCKKQYRVVQRNGSIFDLFVDDHSDEVGRDPAQSWDKEEFERGYEKSGYHESGVEFDRQLGYPAEVSQFLFERVKRRMLEWLQPAAGHRILDVGCGAGYFLQLMRERYRARGFDPQIVGTDISVNQLSYMNERMRKEGIDNAVVAHGNAEFLPFVDGSFDLVTCSEVIEHVRNPQRALAEMHRVLRGDGTLLLSTPSMTAQRGWGILLWPLAAAYKLLRRRSPRQEVAGGGYDIPWYPNDFRGAIQAAGFTILDFEYNAVIPHPWHFTFLPRALVRPVVAVFWFVDRYLKAVTRPLALHFVVRCKKANPDSARMPAGTDSRV